MKTPLLTQPVDPLTARERDILQLVAAGLTNREIGEELTLTLHTVKWYVKQIFAKLQVRRRTEAAAVARALGLLDESVYTITNTDAAGQNEPETFVGREQELRQLNGFWGRAMAGQPQIVFVTGEAGSGKSALVQAFCRRAQARHPQFIAVAGHCNALTGIGDPYLPFCEILTLLTGSGPDRQNGILNQTQSKRLLALMPETMQALVEHGPTLLNTLLDGQALLPVVAQTHATATWLSQFKALLKKEGAPTPSAAITQQRLFAEVTAVLQSLAQQRPLLLVLDDLQWADLGSLNLLFHLSRELRDAPVLIIGIYRASDVALGRNGERHPLAAVVNELQRRFGDQRVDLGQTSSPAFVDALLDVTPNCFSPEFRRAFYRHTRGHALFSVEMLRGLQARGDLVQDKQGRWVAAQQLDWHLLPARMEGVLRERIERLSPQHQQLLQLACVEGETFTAEVIAAIQQREPSTVIQELSNVLDRQHRLIESAGAMHEKIGQTVRYRFRHILFREFLYSHLNEDERLYWHNAVASALETQYADLTESNISYAAQLAWHFQQAGHTAKAIQYSFRAGARAIQLFANAEAIIHFQQVLALLEAQPKTAANMRLALDCHENLVVAMGVMHGHAASILEPYLARAAELAKALDDTEQIFAAAWRLWQFHHVRGELYTAQAQARHLLVHVRNTMTDATYLAAHHAAGCTQFALGSLPEARDHLERALIQLSHAEQQAYIRQYGTHPGVLSRIFLALTLSCLGYPDRAVATINHALALAEQVDHPFSISFALTGAFGVHLLRREPDLVLDYANKTSAFCGHYGILQWSSFALHAHGWSQTMLNKPSAGVKEAEQGFTAWQETGSGLWGARMRAVLAEACMKAGRLQQAHDLIDQALGHVAQTGERLFAAELYRLQGELIWQQAQDSLPFREIEACFQNAIAIAQEQQAKLWELRATVSLSKLWIEQGKHGQAHEQLAKIYGWFTEGFETADLQAARSLMAELQGTT